MTEDNSKQKTIQEQVLAAIKRGDVAMKPRWQFMLKAALAVIGGLLLGLALLYLVSFIIFAVRQTGADAVPAFGARGWFAFLCALPWLLIALSVVFVVVLELLVRHFAFTYRRPLLYSVLVILALALGGGFIVAGTRLHQRLAGFSQHHHVFFGERFYRHFGEREFGDITRGRITATSTSGFIIENPRGQIFYVQMGPQTRVPFDQQFLPGETVVVFGGHATQTIEAMGIRTLPEH